MENNKNTEAAADRPPSVIGNLADLKPGEVILPPFITQRAEGLFVNLAKLEGTEAFRSFVIRVFSSNAYFWELDYACFLQVLYEPDTLSPRTPLRLATDIVAFPAERRALYKSVKIGDGKAEYFFEPVLPEKAGEGVNTEGMLKARLSFDEFVADMWGKGVHFGIEAEVVRTAIQTGKSGRITIARRREAILGKSAGIQELAKEIHRDDTPKELANGKLDLRQFQNRYPQIKKNIRLLKKIPPVIGVMGFDISGHPLEPPHPADFNLLNLAGPGTRLEINPEGEFIVSAQDGFLNFDTETNQISITEKIVGRAGVSSSTGNLYLTGEEYEEHGEIQDKRLVEGNNITIHADVFGTVVSKGGRILLKKNLIGGSATNQCGDIIVEGFASGATLKTQQGGIVIKRAERCTIIGSQVTIEQAFNCDIVSDTVTIQQAEGCAIAAKLLRLGAVAPYKQSEMRVYLQVPDMGRLDRKIHALRAKIEESDPELARYNQEVAKIAEMPEVKKYRTLSAHLKNQTITLSAEQQAGFKKLAATVDPWLKQIVRIQEQSKKIQAERALLAEQIEQLISQITASAAEVACTIKTIVGETSVRTMFCSIEAPLNELSFKDVNAKLRGSAVAGEKLFFGDSGAFHWEYHPHAHEVGKDRA